jgi:hypothetical protein
MRVDYSFSPRTERKLDPMLSEEDPSSKTPVDDIEWLPYQ